MNGILRRCAVLLTLLAGSFAVPPAAGAADDFTLPFYNPAIPLNYGVDRDPRVGYQLDWAGQLWHDTAAHYGRVYDQHTGIDYGMASLSLVPSARNGTVVDIEEGFGTNDHGAAGNFVRVRHADGRETLYYHLAQNGALVSVGQAVVAGQTIGRSGCSGNCSGPHLHFELLQLSGGAWRSIDPMALHLWTTWPGRVPYLAAYRAESIGSTVAIKRFATATHWVEFRNIGGRSWSRDASGSRLLLATWNPPERSSLFRASDWPSYWIATYLDQATVAPDGVGRFTFGLRAPAAVGSYAEAFNLKVDPVAWFDHARLGGYYVPLYVYSGQQP